MDYKDADSFRGSVKARLSALVIGTPQPIFNYFNAQSTSEGNSRRVIMVEHESIPKIFTTPKYTQEEIKYIYQEIDYLLSIGEKEVFHTKIENAANKWRQDKQKNL